MQHFLNGNLEDSPSPPPYETQLLFGDALLDVTLHAEGSKQVAAHDPVLELCGFGEQVNQLGSVLDPDWRVQQSCITCRRLISNPATARRPLCRNRRLEVG